jgi:hypothetical protein
MKICRALISLALSLGTSSAIFAGTDLNVGTGLALGTVSQTLSDGSLKSFQMGGVPLQLGLNKDLAAKLSASIAPQILLDVANRQVVRQGVTASIAYHLIGSAGRLEYPGERFRVTSLSIQNLSLISRAGLFNYAASEPNRPTSNVTGGLWEFAVGFEYRRDVGEESALGLTVMATVLTIPASVQRLKSQMMETLIFWRQSV